MYSFPTFLYNLFCVFVLQVLIFNGQAAIKLPNNNGSTTFPALFIFGDSIVDTGNNNYLILSPVKCNFPPYGKDLPDGIPTGRFSNGKISSDFLVEELGIKEFLPPYLDPNLEDKDLLTGVNFASGGAGYDPLTSNEMLVISLSDQLSLFEDYKMKLEISVGEEKANTIVANSLYIVAAGNNDIAINYFDNPFQFRRLQYNVSSYTDFMLNCTSTFLQDLYKLGARRIGVISVSPVGCVPALRTLKGGIKRGCSKEIDEATQMFNTKLLSQLNFLNNNLFQAKMAYIDAYNTLFDIIQNPNKYGFEVADRGCCGTGLLEVGFICNKYDLLTCKNISKYVFWDSFHPTEKTYKILVHHSIKKLVNDVLM